MSIFKAINNVFGGGGQKTLHPFAPQLTHRPTPRPSSPSSSSHSQLVTFQNSWAIIKNSLSSPKHRHQSLESTSIKERLDLMWECLAVESNLPTNLPLSSELPGAECLEYFLQNEVPGNLVALSLPDQPIGVKGLVINFFMSLVVFMDEQFILQAKVHKPLIRLLRSFIAPDLISDGSDDSSWGDNGENYEEVVVELMCHLCARIKGSPEILLVFIQSRSGSSQFQSTDLGPEFDQPIATTPTNTQIPNSNGLTTQPLRKSVHFSPQPRSTSVIVSEISAIGTNTGDNSTHTTLSSSLSSSSHHSHSNQDPARMLDLDSISNSFKGDSDMLIFSYLLRFLHREGRTGDLARAGLLFLVEIAMGRRSASSQLSQALPINDQTPADTICMAFGEWILDSDFPDVLGASLGAAYGLLPSKLVITPRDPNSEDSTGRMVLGGMGIHFSDDSDQYPQAIQEKEREERRQRLLIGLGVSGSAEFRTQIELFLKLIEFSQDVLRNVNPSTLDHYTSPNELLLSSSLPSKSSSAFDSTSQELQQTPKTMMMMMMSNHEEQTGNQSELRPSEIVASAISSAVLFSIRKSFLDGIIYPSLLECSENDGSAVAVMSYLEASLSLLETDGELSDSVLRFLMAEDNENLHLGATTHTSSHQAGIMQLQPSSPLVSSNRRSSGVISIIQADFIKAKSGSRLRNEGDRLMSDTGITYFNSLGRFTLKDLLVNNIQSTDGPTATAALKLLHVILVRHDRYALALLDIIPDPTATAFPFPHSTEDDHCQSIFPSADSQKSDGEPAEEEMEFVYPIREGQVESQGELEKDEEEEEFKYPDDGQQADNAPLMEGEEFNYPAPLKSVSSKVSSTCTPDTRSNKAPTIRAGGSHCMEPSLELVKKIHYSPCPTYRAHRDGLEYLSNLVELIDPSNAIMKPDSRHTGSLSTAFQHYLLDAEAELTGTATFRRGLLCDYVSASVIPSSVGLDTNRASCQTPRSANLDQNKSMMTNRGELALEFIDHPVIRHQLSTESALISSILESLAKFFLQPPALNLILTGVVATLASCPTRSLEGWMLPTSHHSQNDDDSFDQSILASCAPRNLTVDDDEGDDRSIDFAVDEYVNNHQKYTNSTCTKNLEFPRINHLQNHSSDREGADCLLEVYRQLAEQVAGYRRKINSFDKYLKERRQGLIFVENLEDALDNLPINPLKKSEDSENKEQKLVKSSSESRNRPTAVVNNPKPVGPIQGQQATKTKESSFFASLFKPSKAQQPTSSNNSHHKSRNNGSLLEIDDSGVISRNKNLDRTVAVKPFSDHYQQTGTIKLDIVPVSTPRSSHKKTTLKMDFLDDADQTDDENEDGPESPTKKTRNGADSTPKLPGHPGSRRSNHHPQPVDQSLETCGEEETGKSVISLSMVLDNVVILEESIKELGAILSARKSLGIDPVRIL